jgi:hypothetical protein
MMVKENIQFAANGLPAYQPFFPRRNVNPWKYNNKSGKPLRIYSASSFTVLEIMLIIASAYSAWVSK